MTWTDERVELLKRLWAEGLSASQIAAQLGGGITRNAVIGKVHRLGLAGRAKPAASTAGRAARRPRTQTLQRARPLVIGATALKASPIVEPRRLAIREPEILEVPESLHATILTLSDQTCKWPIGDPAAENFHFCGHRPRTGTPYCEYHARLAYQPVTERRRDRRLETA